LRALRKSLRALRLILPQSALSFLLIATFKIKFAKLDLHKALRSFHFKNSFYKTLRSLRLILPQSALSFFLLIATFKLSSQSWIYTKLCVLYYFYNRFYKTLRALRKSMRTLRLNSLYFQGKINFTLAIKITVPNTIFNVLLEKEPLP